MELRKYQSEMETKIYEAWQNDHINVMPVLPTGGGKTVIFAKLLADCTGRCIAIAHRQELVGQISLALATLGVYHRIFAPLNVAKFVIDKHLKTLGKSYFDPNSKVAVGGVDTILARKTELSGWLSQVTLWVQDEGHHILRANKWGKVCALMPKSRGVAPTATPMRADGKGLGRHADGIIDVLIVGPTGRDLINRGFLTDYIVYAPKTTDLDLSDVAVGATGDYVPKKLKTAVRKSRIIGDIVDHYKKIVPGKLGVTFCTDVETATDIAAAYCAAGVPAEAVHAKTPDQARARAIERLTRRELLQLVNVDLFGEGFDLPAIEVVTMARPTESYPVYSQQFGRMLRIMKGKKKAILIDHVGNIKHGLPDGPREWTLDRRDKRGTNNTASTILIKVCPNPQCNIVYERFYKTCPHCGHTPVPQFRSKPEHVDGDLIELSPEALSKLRGDIDKIDEPPEEVEKKLVAKKCPPLGVLSHLKRHRGGQSAQLALREILSWWGGLQRSQGLLDSESYRKFFLLFSIDIMSAQGLKQKEALILANRVSQHLGGNDGIR